MKKGLCGMFLILLVVAFGNSALGQPPFMPMPGGSRGASGASPAGELEGNVYVVADPDTNSLIVLTDKENHDRVKQIISDLDRVEPQVLIEVLIAEVTRNDALDIPRRRVGEKRRPAREGDLLAFFGGRLKSRSHLFPHDAGRGRGIGMTKEWDRLSPMSGVD